MRIAFILGPSLFFAADVLVILSDQTYVFASGFLQWLGLLCFLAALFGLSNFATKGSKLAMAGIISGCIGLMAASCITALYRVEVVLRSNFNGQAFEPIEEALLQSSIIPTIFPFSPLFPLGLILIVIAIGRSNTIPIWLLAAIGLGALLFLVGRLSNIVAVQIISDVFLLIGLGGMALRSKSKSTLAV